MIRGQKRQHASLVNSVADCPIVIAPRNVQASRIGKRADQRCGVAGDGVFRANRDQAWLDFQGWRVNYDKALVSLAHMVIAPDGRWSSDRPGQPFTPSFRSAARPDKRRRSRRS